MIRVAIDIKNFSQFGTGITAFFKPLLILWIKKCPDVDFFLIGPPHDFETLPVLSNCHFINTHWPSLVPRFLRHPFYDNYIFPRAISSLKPDFVFSPYHDVRLPRNIPSVMMIHDTCIGDLKKIYPPKVRFYYETMLKINLSSAKAVLTVSDASKSSILDRYNVTADNVHVVYNTLSSSFLSGDFEEGFKLAEQKKGLNIFYTGGNEYRKNINRLLEAVSILLTLGHEPWLWVTGECNDAWKYTFSKHDTSTIDRVRFVGRLSFAELRAQYLAADVVVYPSLCEGFGRGCLEAMVLGIPIACSNIPVFHEVAGDEAFYFDPLNSEDIANKILLASQIGPKSPIIENRFSQEVVSANFLAVMDKIIAKECFSG